MVGGVRMTYKVKIFEFVLCTMVIMCEIKIIIIVPFSYFFGGHL